MSQLKLPIINHDCQNVDYTTVVTRPLRYKQNKIIFILYVKPYIFIYLITLKKTD